MNTKPSHTPKALRILFKSTYMELERWNYGILLNNEDKICICMTSFTGCNVTFSFGHKIKVAHMGSITCWCDKKYCHPLQNFYLRQSVLKFLRLIMSINFIDAFGRQIVFLKIEVRRRCALNCIFLTPKRNKV